MDRYLFGREIQLDSVRISFTFLFFQPKAKQLDKPQLIHLVEIGNCGLSLTPPLEQGIVPNFKRKG